MHGIAHSQSKSIKSAVRTVRSGYLMQTNEMDELEEKDDYKDREYFTQE